MIPLSVSEIHCTRGWGKKRDGPTNQRTRGSFVPFRGRGGGSPKCILGVGFTYRERYHNMYLFLYCCLNSYLYSGFRAMCPTMVGCSNSEMQTNCWLIYQLDGWVVTKLWLFALIFQLYSQFLFVFLYLYNVFVFVLRWLHLMFKFWNANQ